MAFENTARLLITCPDRPGIVAAVAGFMHNHGANITALDQHSTDPEGGRFFMRLEFQTPYLDVGIEGFERAFNEVVASRFDMDYRLTSAAEKKRVVILVSRAEHALLELLWQARRGRLRAHVSMVISNHEALRAQVEAFNLEFRHVDVSAGRKAEAEAEILEALGDETDLVVLARYMQILSTEFVDQFHERIINIHHSFLPAFAGADPYRQAYERGVKVIGATAHYVTAGLDEGPIIEQDVVHIDHRHTVRDMRALGRGLERDVLARAVRHHLEDRIIVHENKTVVFAH